MPGALVGSTHSGSRSHSGLRRAGTGSRYSQPHFSGRLNTRSARSLIDRARMSGTNPPRTRECQQYRAIMPEGKADVSIADEIGRGVISRQGYGACPTGAIGSPKMPVTENGRNMPLRPYLPDISPPASWPPWRPIGKCENQSAQTNPLFVYINRSTELQPELFRQLAHNGCALGPKNGSTPGTARRL